ncbi:MAG: hypothetical protein AAF626_11725 [Pseudomonadota bacterium]
MTPVFRSFGFGAMIAALPLFGHAQEAAPTLDLEFRPPDVAFDPICVARPPDDEITQFWGAWDREVLPTIDPAFVKRDLKRLQQIDARTWFATVDAMITLLAEQDPGFAGQNALLTRILAMEAAGKFTELEQLGLVPQLAEMAGASSARIQNALSRFYRDGVGVSRDVEKADELLVAAGFLGNADALLALSKMTLEGATPKGWDVPVDLAVTMAFGGLVGELNETICDRTARIAREYHNGEIVTADTQLAHDWYRFTADLGDAYAAWKVVEYHIRAEGFVKDNATLLKYLNQAADAELPFAQIELGRLYQAGSLVEQDLDRALTLFRAAAATGERPGLTRVALFLEEYRDRYPEHEAERLAALRAISALPDAPGWVFTRLAQNVIDTQGRWEGESEAIALLEEATRRGDMDGTTRLAMMLIAKRSTAEEFERAVDLLSRSVSVHGGVTPSKRLAAAFLCQAVDSPRLAEAAHWRGLEEATASANIDLPVHRLIQLTPEANPHEIAVIQSQALYGRPTSLASWLKYLDYAPFANDEMRLFWEGYSGRYSDVLKALAKLELELANSRDERLAAFDLLRREYRQSGAPAALELARALLDYETADDASQDEIFALLEEPAAAGIGAAIQLIAGLTASESEARQVYERYADIIERNGDFDALVFAVPFVEGAQRELYLSRAVGVMPCDYKNVMAMAALAEKLGDHDQVLHWLDIAGHLLGGNAWAMTDLAENKLAALGSEAAEEARALFARAYELGDGTAARGLFDLAIDDSVPTYDPAQAIAMIKAAADSEEVDVLRGFLGRYRKASDAVRAEVETRLDLPQIYLVAARHGDIYSMRAYGQFLQANAVDGRDLAQSTEWLRKAAEGGDTTAMAEYGEALAFGIGTAADPDAAILWLERAAAGGSRKATEIVTLVRLSRGS